MNYTTETLTVDGRKYIITRRGDVRVDVSSIHPYDESSYHWARTYNNKEWTIYNHSPRPFVDRITAETIEEVAKCLAAHDAGISPKICHD